MVRHLLREQGNTTVKKWPWKRAGFQLRRVVPRTRKPLRSHSSVHQHQHLLPARFLKGARAAAARQQTEGVASQGGEQEPASRLPAHHNPATFPTSEATVGFQGAPACFETSLLLQSHPDSTLTRSFFPTIPQPSLLGSPQRPPARPTFAPLAITVQLCSCLPPAI